MFSRIAGVYDFLNHFLSLGIDRTWRLELARLATQKDASIIPDIAAGTLDVAIAVHKFNPQALIPAIDFCPLMLKKGIQKLDTSLLREKITPMTGDAFHLPLKDNIADSLTMAFGIRNVTPREQAFREMLRVLIPGGKVCILEFGSGQDRIWGGIYNCYLKYFLPAIGKIIARNNEAYAYLSRSILDFPSAAKLAQEMETVGFNAVGYKKLTSGIVCLHWGCKPMI